MIPREELPEFLQKMLDDPPKTGEGVHTWLFKVARQLHAHWPSVEIVKLLEQESANCGRYVPRREIVAAVADALKCAWSPNGNGPQPASPRWPDRNQEQIEAVSKDYGGLKDLREVSPVRFGDNKAHTEELIDRLFPGDPLLCCGRSSYSFDTRPREEWRGILSEQQLIVPSPMAAITGMTKAGHQSKHSENNTGLRTYLVIEQDSGTIDLQSAILMHLATRGPMALAVYSGGKSIHGWFYCLGHPEEKLLKFFRYAVSLGACSSTWSCSQFVRMPDGLRDNGRRQAVHYFAPEVIK